MKKAFSKSPKRGGGEASVPLSQQPAESSDLSNPFAEENPFSAAPADKHTEVESVLSAYRSSQQQSPAGFGAGGSSALDDVPLWPAGGAALVPPPAPAPVEQSSPSWVSNNAYVAPAANPFQDAGEHTSVAIPSAWGTNGNSE